MRLCAEGANERASERERETERERRERERARERESDEYYPQKYLFIFFTQLSRSLP